MSSDIVLRTKDGRCYLVQVRSLGRTIEQPVRYRSRYQRALFHLAGEFRMWNGMMFPLYQQPTLRSQTNLTRIPSDWLLVEGVKA